MLLLTDDDLLTVSAREAVDCMLAALRLRATGGLSSPPRASADLVDGRLVLTAGRGPNWYGYRVYDTLPTAADQQVVVAHDARTGEVTAIHVGSQLGAMRTGALGGAAASLLGPEGSAQVAVVGAGVQAWTQLWALSAVLDIAEVRVASRTAASRDALADRARTELRLPARAVDSPRRAVSGADAVVLATSSPTPVIDAAWLAADVFVTTLGPKQVGRAEFALDLLDAADLVATDSPAQLGAYSPPALVADAGTSDVLDLAEIAAGRVTGDVRRGRRVYLSVGLAGTEVQLLGHLAAGGSQLT